MQPIPEYSKEDIKVNRVMFVIFLLIFGLPVLWLVFKGLTYTSDETAELRALNVTATTDASGINLVNESGEQVRDCTVYINRDYRYGKFFIDDKGSIPYTKITKSNGERFNIITTKPNSIVLDCDGYEVMEYS